MNQNTVSGNLDRIKRATDDMRLITGTTGEDIETVAQAVSDLNDDNIAKDETIAELEQEIEDLQPSGTINVSSNGITNVAGYQYADVNISSYPIDITDKVIGEEWFTHGQYMLTGLNSIAAVYTSLGYDYEVQEKQYRAMMFYDETGELLGFHSFIMPYIVSGQENTYTTEFTLPDASRTYYIKDQYVYGEYEDWEQPEPRVKMHIYNNTPDLLEIDEDWCIMGTVPYDYQLPDGEQNLCDVIFEGDILCLASVPLYIYVVYKNGGKVLMHETGGDVSGRQHISVGLRCPNPDGSDETTVIGISIGSKPQGGNE